MFCLFPLLAEVRVQLVPYFPWLPVALQVAAFAGGLFLLLALVVWLYRYESRLVAPGTARLLLGLRAVALGLLWAVLSLRPVVAHVSSETVPGQVFVALDRSDSMRIADP